MNWKDEIIIIEKKRDWKAAIQLTKTVNENEPSIYLRSMFLLLDLLIDGQYSEEEYKFAIDNLKGIFNKSNQRFSTNAEFLFFAGIMIYIGEWCFGIKSIKTATTMLENAMNMKPESTLYRWGYYSRIDQRLEENTLLKINLSEHLLFEDPYTIDWLKSKGLLGLYVLGTLEETYKHLKKIKVS